MNGPNADADWRVRDNRWCCNHAIRFIAALRKKPDLVAPAHGPVRKLDRLGNMTLEVETESAAPRQRLSDVVMTLQAGPNSASITTNSGSAIQSSAIVMHLMRLVV